MEPPCLQIWISVRRSQQKTCHHFSQAEKLNTRSVRLEFGSLHRCQPASKLFRPDPTASAQAALLPCLPMPETYARILVRSSYCLQLP